MPGDLSAPGSIMKQGTESVLAFCHVIPYITSFGVMKLGTGFGAHTTIHFSKLYWTQPSPVKGILVHSLILTWPLQRNFSARDHELNSVNGESPFLCDKEKMEMPHATLTWNDQSSTWNYRTNVRLFSSFKRIAFHNSGVFFLLFRTITHCISPHHKIVSYVSLLRFKWFMTHSFIVVCYTVIVISIIWYMSHFLCT